MRSLIAPLVLGLPAFAQGSPSAEQIINSLRPGGTLAQGGTRGIRITKPATDAAVLTPDAMRTLDDLGRALSSKELAGYRSRIEGHTDTVGSRDYNRLLSERRAG